MSERIACDSYQTPYPLALAICRRLEALIPAPYKVVEPSAGSGAFVRSVMAVWRPPELVTVDVRGDLFPREEVPEHFCGDWLSLAGRITEAQLILGNPPYSKAEEHVTASLTALTPGGHLAFLLRLSFLGSAGRAKRLWSNPGLRWLAPISPRPSFTGGGSDNSEYALFVWERGYAGNAEILAPLVWAPERKLESLDLMSYGGIGK